MSIDLPPRPRCSLIRKLSAAGWRRVMPRVLDVPVYFLKVLAGVSILSMMTACGPSATRDPRFTAKGWIEPLGETINRVSTCLIGIGLKNETSSRIEISMFTVKYYAGGDLFWTVKYYKDPRGQMMLYKVKADEKFPELAAAVNTVIEPQQETGLGSTYLNGEFCSVPLKVQAATLSLQMPDGSQIGPLAVDTRR